MPVKHRNYDCNYLNHGSKKKRTFPGGPREDETAPPGWGGFLFGAMVEPE